MILETSVQARFLIPMAISLGFGVLFATFIILVIVPSSYIAAEDAKWAFGVGLYRFKDWRKRYRNPNDDHDADHDTAEPGLAAAAVGTVIVATTPAGKPRNTL